MLINCYIPCGCLQVQSSMTMKEDSLKSEFPTNSNNDAPRKVIHLPWRKQRNRTAFESRRSKTTQCVQNLYLGIMLKGLRGLFYSLNCYFLPQLVLSKQSRSSDCREMEIQQSC